MTRLSKELLEAAGWKYVHPTMTKDFNDCEGHKYRIGWSPETHRVYLGYSQ